MSEIQRFEPGIYLGLEEKLYHDDDALGSTDIRLLIKGPEEYWYRSRMNPHRPRRRDTEATIYGSAVHKLVLEGDAAFDRTYARRPDDFEGAKPSDKAKTTKEHNERCVRNGMTGLHGDDYDRCLICREMIIRNPELADALSNSLREVSVFWEEMVEAESGERMPVRCKMRIDILKAGAIGDIKNVTNIFKDDFVEACWHAQEKLRLDVQAELYLRGRRMMPALHKAGRFQWCSGPSTTEDQALLAKIMASRNSGWQWIFYAAGENDAPSIYSETLRPGNEILTTAAYDVDIALARFVEWRARFGEGMWCRILPVTEADINNYSQRYGRTTRRPT